MDTGTFKALELILFFGAVFGFGFWQLYKINRIIAERDKRKPEEGEPGRRS